MALDDILLEAEEKMIKTDEVVQHEFSRHSHRQSLARPGRKHHGRSLWLPHAHPRIGRHHHPEPRVLVIQPWDVATVHPIEKAILKSNLGVTPAVQGKIIRLVLPELSQERRQEMVKIVHKLAEDGRVAVRHVRRDAIEAVKKESKAGGVAEDQVEVAEKEIQKLTDEYIAKIDVHLAAKEKEIMTV